MMKIEDLPGWPPTMELMDEGDLCLVFGGRHELCPQVASVEGNERRVLCTCWCHKPAEKI
jgi:hypothetical protein